MLNASLMILLPGGGVPVKPVSPLGAHGQTGPEVQLFSPAENPPAGTGME